MTARGSDPGPGPDELRRRIYRPGATDDDRARYRAVTASQPVSSAAVAASADPPTKPPAHPLITRTARTARARSRRAGLLPAAAVAVAALAGIAMGLLPPAAGGPPASSPRAIAVDDSTRGEFVRNLATGDGAGIAAYLVTHGSPPQFGMAHRFYTIERSGTGRGSIS